MKHESQQHRIKIKKLGEEEILRIYQTYSADHFPPDELKPVASIQRMIKEGIYAGYGLYSDCPDSLLYCYALFTILPDCCGVLLDYFAVMEEYRSCGIGSQFLHYMKEADTGFGGLIIESEDPGQAASKEELMIRNKRLAFYYSNGAEDTGIRARIFGVPYYILYLPLSQKADSDQIEEELKNIYRHMVNPKHYENDVRIQNRCEE